MGVGESCYTKLGLEADWITLEISRSQPGKLQKGRKLNQSIVLQPQTGVYKKLTSDKTGGDLTKTKTKEIMELLPLELHDGFMMILC